jgi:hypothetical protein
MRFLRLSSGLFMAAAITCAFAGCNRHDNKTDAQAKANIDAKRASHEGWWCQEHGVPEELCSICMSEAVAKKKFKDNGDWCKEHDRAESQCFKCDPKRYKKFEDMYVAKYGKKPESPPEEEFKK